MNLTVSQKAAIDYISTYACKMQSVGQNELDNVLAMLNISSTTYDEALRQIKKTCPDWAVVPSQSNLKKRQK